jgi:hypothetical protein
VALEPAASGATLAAVGAPPNPWDPDHPVVRRRGPFRFLLTPAGVLITIPALVLAVGIHSTWSGYRTGHSIGRTMAEAQMQDLTEQARDTLAAAAALADQLLAGMADFLNRHDGNPTADDFAGWGREQLTGRPTVAQLNLGRADGRFQGVARQADDGFIYSDRQIVDGRTEHRDFRLAAGNAAPVPAAVRYDTGYDPRGRDWYRAAVERKTTIWTAPYVFFASGVTGITCARPWHDAGGIVRGVCAVDFDVRSLADFARHFTVAGGGQSFLFTDDGILLAHPRASGRPADAGANERTLFHLAELHDPVLDAFFAIWCRDRSDRAFTVSVDGTPYLVRADPCPIAPGTVWRFGQVVPATRFAGPAREHVTRAAITGGIVLLVAVLAAVIFAVTLIRTERIARRTADSLSAARHELRELGSYRLIEKLGEGGMGEVWLARHTLLAFPAAVKLIHPRALRGDDDGESTESLYARFQREALALAGLRSPSTIRLYDFGRSPDGALYYVMELLDGLDLDALVREVGPLPAGRVVPILIAICASLAEAHDLGLAHRDLKPANVYLCRQGDEVDQVKVLDFGMVRRMGIAADQRLTMAGYIQGTPTCMSPEQIRDEALGPPSDLYALGCVAYWLLSGRLVFDGPAMDVLSAHLHVEPPPLREVSPAAVPDLLCDLVMACLAKDPADRPQDARELRQRLEALRLPDHGGWTIDDARAWWHDRPGLAARLGTANTDETLVKQILERG